MPTCCAINCHLTKGVRFFTLPRKNPERCAQWITNINRENLPRSALVCEKHFTEDQFEENRSDKKLKWNAVPTVFDFTTAEGPSCRKRKRRNPILDMPSEITVSSLDETTPDFTIPDHDSQILIQQLEMQLTAAHSQIKTLTEQNNNLLNNLKKIFEPDQIEQLMTSNSKSNKKWSQASMRKYLKLYLACGTTGYEELRRQNYPLPSIRTLQRKIHAFKCMPEIHQEIFNLLEAKVESLLPEERHAVLLMDEMAIKSGLQFDNNSGQIIGRPSMKNSGGNNTDELATHALVFMLAGITTRWKQTIGYQLTSNSFDANEANSIISKIIIQCQSINLDVCAVISDMGPQNQAVWRLNNITAGRHSKVNTFNHVPISDKDTKKVFFLPDPTHIYKNVRLALSDNIFRISEEIVNKFNLPSNEISVEPITAVIEEDKQVELKIAPYLKEIHIHPQHFDKMKVQGAMAILNHDVAAAIKYYISKGKIAEKHLTTAWFLEIIHKWYNIMSSRTIKQGLSKNNIDEYHATINFLHSFIEITRNIYIGTKGRWKPIQRGMLLATTGILELQESFLNIYNFKFLLLSRFTQDALENLFSNIRSKNPVPTAKEFKTILRLISISQYFVEPSYGNYGITNDIPLVDLLASAGSVSDTDEEMSNNVETLEFNSSMDITLPEKESLFYLLGSVIKNIRTNQLHCDNCMSFVIAENKNSITEFKFLTDLKSYKEGSLIYPSKQIFEIGLQAELFFREHAIQLTSGILKLEQLTSLFLDIVDGDIFPTCHIIIKRFINLFFKSRLHILLRSEYSFSTPYESVKYSSKSIGMRAAVLNII